MATNPGSKFAWEKRVVDLPSADATVEFEIRGVLLTALGHALGMFVAFVCVFFSVRGPDGRWPEAWWAFCFLGVAAGQFTHAWRSEPNKVVFRNNETVEFFNGDRALYGGPTALGGTYEAFAIPEGCKKKVVLVRTDEHMAKMKETHKCCARCIGKEYALCFSEEDVQRFHDEFGRATA